MKSDINRNLIFGTPKRYYEFLENAKISGYKFFPVFEYKTECDKKIILRHDVDFSLEYALEMAKIENELNIVSTYYVMISGEFYNILDAESLQYIFEIKSLGHEVGLHFSNNSLNIFQTKEESLLHQINILSSIIDSRIYSYSQHDPTKDGLLDIKLENLINAYDLLKENFNYISDSGMMWYKNTFEESINGTFRNLYILAHPITWCSNNPQDLIKTLKELSDLYSKKINNTYERFISEQYDYWNRRVKTGKFILDISEE